MSSFNRIQRQYNWVCKNIKRAVIQNKNEGIVYRG